MPDDFPYRSHGQPITAYLSLTACLFILIVANGASLWKDFHVQPFLSAYLAVSAHIAFQLPTSADDTIADLFRSALGLAEGTAQGPVAFGGFEWRGAGEEDVEVA